MNFVNQTQIRMQQLNGSNDEEKRILAEEVSNAEDAGTSGSSNSQPRFPSKTAELLYKYNQ